MKPKAGRTKKAKRALRPRGARGIEDRGEITDLAEKLAGHRETGPGLTAGDVDADWMRAHDSGDEAAGGSVATPDQDVVDEIGRALGVPQDPDAEVRTSEEILHDRDRFRWHLERDAKDADEGRARPRRTSP
ncbi:MAG: hypothetical protein HY359_13530 [Candidatus Rokubacteria bacterium]|nr:hypothetical protein [Candidatus Rokubacteria bacterium]